MSKYYLATKPNITGFHSVHKEGCPFLQKKGKSIALGEFDSCKDALWKAKTHHCNSNACIFCSKESISINSPSIFEWNMFSTS
ncbi:MAG: hypothetical protein AB7S48_15240 [Bacteroidales bacterium]